MTGADYLREHGVELAVATECRTKISDAAVRYRCEDAEGEVFYRVRYLTGDSPGRSGDQPAVHFASPGLPVAVAARFCSPRARSTASLRSPRCGP